MKVELNKSEWWPVYEVSTSIPSMCDIEIPNELFIRHQAAYGEFTAVQEELKRIYKEHTNETD